MDNMTALVSAFARAYHYRNNDTPSVLARCVFCERAIDNAVKIGCEQVVLYACGYDTFSLRNQRKGLKIYELDKPEMICDKQCRIKQVGLQPSGQIEYISCDLSLSSWREELINRGFDSGKPSFGSLLGISYYLSKEEWGASLERSLRLPVKGHPSALTIRLLKTEQKVSVTGRLPLRRANR